MFYIAASNSMNSGIPRSIALLLFLALSQAVQSQGFKEGISIGLQAHYGSFITSLPRSMYIKDSYSSLSEISLIQQTDGSKSWQRANGLPSWGIALVYGNSGSREYIGRMAGSFVFTGFNLARLGSFTSGIRLGAGLGWIQKPYDPVTNHKNLLLGSNLNFLLNLLWKNEIRIRGPLYINAGISFTHLSNGRLVQPNLGLNIPALSAGIRYVVTPVPVSQVLDKDAFHKKTGVLISTSAGIKQIPTPGSRRYLVNVVTAEISRKFSGSGAYGLGLFTSYDRSAGDHYADSLISSKAILLHPFSAALYVSYEQLLGRISIPIQFGRYLTEKINGESFYQDFGLRYHINEKLCTGIRLKTHFGHADFIHLGLSYQFEVR